MTDEELDSLTDLLLAAGAEPTLTSWEKNFIEDMKSQVDKWGVNIRISVKQWDILHKIEEKCN